MTRRSTKRTHPFPTKILAVDSSELRDYIDYLGSPSRVFWSNFLAGTARGLGLIFGTIVILGILVYVISNYLTQVPWIGELFRWIDVWLKANLESYS